MNQTTKILIGIDGGGTYTRVAVTDFAGNLLAYLEHTGGASLRKTIHAKKNVQQAIRQALVIATKSTKDVACLVAGIAGFDNEDERTQVSELTDIEGLLCPRYHLNDSVVAAFGAFASKPGIVVIAGTGSIVFGITEASAYLRSYDFSYYAPIHARGLAYTTVAKLLAGETDHTDSALCADVLAYCNVSSLSALALLGSQGFEKEERERNMFFSALAPAITRHALAGSHLAQTVCNRAAEDLATGARLLGACFTNQTIPVALLGGVVNSDYMYRRVSDLLHQKANRTYTVVAPALPAVLGAVTHGLEQGKVPITSQIFDNLCRSAATIARRSRG